MAYNSAPLKFSDHRPVYALFQCTVNIIDEQLRDKISRDLYKRRKADVGEATANGNTEDTEDEDLIGYEAIEPGLPPASSDRQKWWLDNGKQARSTVVPPKSIDGSHSTILNPNRPANPFVPTDEPDWVTVPRAGSRLSSFSSMSTSPYEHINHSSFLPSVSSTPPRKLPPPYDPSALPARLARMATNDDQHQMQFKKKEVLPPPAPPPRRQTAQMYFPPPPNQTPIPTSGTQNIKQVPAPPPPRPASAASGASGASQKTIKGPPPAVAKKPQHLTTSPTPPSADMFLDTTKGRPTPPRRPSSSIQSVSRSALAESLHRTASARENSSTHSTPVLPPPRRAGTSHISSPSSSGIKGWTPPGSVGLVGLSKGGDRPALPARKPVPPPPPSTGVNKSATGARPIPPPARKPVTRSAAVDLLGDHQGDAMGGWEALKPT